MNNLTLKWHDIDVSFLKENDDVMVNLTDMAKGFPKKNLNHIMNSKEMREYIQAIKRRYEARKSETQIYVSLNEDQKSEIQNCISTDSQSVTDTETKIQNCILTDSQSVTDDETKLRNIILPDSQSVTDDETKTKICVLPDFQPVRVVRGEKTRCSKNNRQKPKPSVLNLVKTNK